METGVFSRFDFLLFPLKSCRRSNYPSAVAKLREQNQHEERNEAQSLMWIIRGWLVQLKVSRQVYTLRFLSPCADKNSSNDFFQ